MNDLNVFDFADTVIDLLELDSSFDTLPLKVIIECLKHNNY